MTPEEIVCKTFGVHRSQVSDATSNTTLPQWDSLGHVTLIMELEGAYGVSLSTEETLAMTSVGAIKRLLAERGARW